MDRPRDRPSRGGFAHVFAAAIALAFGGSGIASGQSPNAGQDQSLVFPAAAQLSATVQGGTPLVYWTGDGNGATENDLLLYDDRTGVTAVGPLRLATGGSFGYPTDITRIG